MDRMLDRILIVDDTSASLKLLATILTQAGYTVFPADSGELALETVHNCEPDLVFLDINMPGMNGFDVLKCLKDSPATSNIPVIMISSADDKENQLKCFKLGAVDFIIKPFIEAILLARTKTHLEVASLRNELEAKNSQLIESGSNLRATLNATTDGVLAVEGKGGVLFCNDKFIELWKLPQSHLHTYDDEALLRHVLNDLLDPDAFMSEVKRLYNSNESSFDTLHFKDGRVFERYSLPLQQVDSPLQGRVWSFRDVTERKRLEAERTVLERQFQHAQKLESLGVLSGGIAHDFNNILAIIVGYCFLTKMDYETAENNILEIEKAAERAAGLCRQMLSYAGKVQLTKSQINMWMMVDEMVTMLKSTLPKNAVIRSDLSAQIPYIWADESQIRQIVMNLIINASEAVGTAQGEIQVSLSGTTVTDGQATRDYHGIAIPLGEYVCLEVTDNGCGMDEETKWRIFEPFYTTKFTGRGLGMSAVLGIIKSHNGVLQLHSQLGQGTTFKVYLPVQISEQVADESKQQVDSVPWQGSGTILLVDDEDSIRNIARALLKKIGFTVLEAVNGKEALELYQKNVTDIRLVVTDMGMPVMDGYELFHQLKKINPKLPIIVSSGYGDAEVSSRIDIDDIAGLISKPYNPDKLREVLKRALDGI